MIYDAVVKDFVETCRQGSELRRGLDDRGLGYLMENTEMYSMRDLFEVGIMVFHMQVDLLLFPPLSQPLILRCNCFKHLLTPCTIPHQYADQQQ